MSIKRTIITAIVGLTLVAVVAPGVVQGVTIDELMAQIATLQAQLTGLSGSTPVPTGNVACAGITFTRNLTVGATGSDVKCLQVLLNNNGYTLAQTGAGSPGMETSYFGTRTLAVVKQFQAAKGMVPANQVGPMTRQALNALINSGTTYPPATQLPAGCTSTAGFSPTTGASCATGVINVVPTGAGLAVSLAYDNPAAGSVLSGTSSGQAQAPLAKLTFTNGDNAAVKVTTLRLNRIGVSSDSALSNVYLFNGAVRLTDAAAVSAGVISFNDSTGLFTIPAGSSITVTVTADIAAAMTGTIGVSLNASTNVVTTASSVKGVFPINGNLMNIVNSGTNLATAYLSTQYATNSVYDVTPSGSSLDPQNDVTVWNTNVTVSISNGTVKLSRIALQEVGSIAYSDVQNLRLFVGGVQVSNVVANLDANGYVTFDLSSLPVSISSGTKEIKVLADIIGGSSRTFSFQLKTVADISLVDSQYNVNITPTLSNGSSTSVAFSALRSCYTLSTTTYGCTVNAGATTTTKATDSPSGNIVNAASGATLAKYTLKANGERIKVDNLRFYALFTNTVTTSDDTASATSVTLRNAALYANGVQVGNSFNLPTVTEAYVATVTPATISLGSSLIVDPLAPVTLELKADIYDNSGVNDIDATDIIQVKMVAGSGNGTGMISSTSANVPTSILAANQVTVAQGSIEVAQQSNYANQSVVVPQTNYKLAAFNLSGNSSEAVNVNTIAVNFTPVSYTDFNYLDLSDVYVKYGTSQTQSKATVAATGTSWTVSNFTVPVNGIVPIEVYATIGSSMTTTASIKAETTISGITASSGQTASTTAMVDGQTIAAAAGSFTGTKDVASTPVTSIVPDNNTIQVASYKFTAVNDSYTITKLTFTMAAAGTTAIKNNGVVLKYGTTEIARTSGATTMVFNLPATGTGSVQVVPGTSKVLTVNFELGTIGVGAGTSGGTLTVTLDADSKAIATSSGTEAAMTIGTGAANALYAYASIPTITNVALPSSVLAIGGSFANTLAKFTVSSGGTGTVAWNKVILNVAKSANPTIADSGAIKLYDADTGLEVPCDTKAASGLTGGATTAGTFTFVTTSEQEISGAKTYMVKATLGGSATVNTEYISTNIPAQSINYVAPVINSTAVGANGGGSSTLASFVWSDESAESHSTATADWNNDWLVKNLPTDAQRLTY